MPKDNEVDEKVKPVAWIVTNGGESCEPWLEYEQSEVDALPAVCIAETLYSAATVAELRAKADAAERRVGELEAKARNWDDLIAARAETARDPNDAEWKMLARQGRKIEAVRACRALHGYSLTEAINCVEALTGADPT